MEWLASNWWLVLIFVAWYGLSRYVRKGEADKKKGAEEGFDQLAREIAHAAPTATAKIFENAMTENAGASGAVKNPIAKVALKHAANAAIEELEKDGTPEEIIVGDGEHTLDAFARNAVESEQTKSKIVSGAKTAGVFILKIAKAAL